MTCPDCGAALDSTPVGEPCPRCAGSGRDATVTPPPATTTASMPPPRIITESELDDGSKEQIVGSHSFRTASRSTADSKSHQHLQGRPVRGESDVLEVCEVLRQALLAAGVVVSKFRKPDGPERGVDAVADSQEGEVRVQVTGVLPRHQQAELGRMGSTKSSRTAHERAEDVSAAIKRKMDTTSRHRVILALDSIRSFEHVQQEVLSILAQQPFKTIALSSGFKSVWLVGPTQAHAHRLA
jgi:hypothetical protein